MSATAGYLVLNSNASLDEEKTNMLTSLGILILKNKHDVNKVGDAEKREQIRTFKRRLYYSKPEVKSKRKEYYEKPEVKERRLAYNKKDEVKERKKEVTARKARLIKTIREKNADLYNAIMLSDVKSSVDTPNEQ